MQEKVWIVFVSGIDLVMECDVNIRLEISIKILCQSHNQSSE